MAGKQITEKPQIVTIEEVAKETPTVTTLRFKYDFETRPGQFYMVWIPGVDEVPMSVSYVGKLKGITVRNVGEATNALTSLKVGDKIGIRGPYGNGYKTTKGKTLFVCGGTGAASLAPMIEEVGKKRATVVIGAKTKDEILLKSRLEKSAKVIISTDDGSCGVKGFATCAVEELLGKEKFNEIITCGPEIMMVKIFQLAEMHKIPIQASLERYMKCGIGICGQCCMDGYTVCKDGPIFTGNQLRQIKDFGKPHRDASGKRMAH